MAATSPPLAVACLLSLLLCLLSPPTTAEQVLVITDKLQPGRTLFNKDREYRFIMQWNCDVVLYEVSNTVWSSDTAGNGSTCQTKLTNSGNLVVVRGDGRVLWSSPAPAATTYYVMGVTSDRNVVIYSKIAWSTGTNVADAGHRASDQILLQGETLRIGEYLANADLNYQLLMQEDCNLVLYDAGRPIWKSGTAGKGQGCTAKLNPTGRLVIQDAQGSFVAGTNNHSPYKADYSVLLLPDRRVVVAYGSVWETATQMPRLADGLSSNSSSTSSAAAAADIRELNKGRMQDAAGNMI